MKQYYQRFLSMQFVYLDSCSVVDKKNEERSKGNDFVF